jgi:hypothetical protein
VILHPLFRVAKDTVVHAEQIGWGDDESGFFAGLADGGFADEFSDFEDAAGDGPLGLERRVRAPYGRTRASSMMMAPTPTSGVSGYSRSIVEAF